MDQIPFNINCDRALRSWIKTASETGTKSKPIDTVTENKKAMASKHVVHLQDSPKTSIHILRSLRKVLMTKQKIIYRTNKCSPQLVNMPVFPFSPELTHGKRHTINVSWSAEGISQKYRVVYESICNPHGTSSKHTSRLCRKAVFVDGRRVRSPGVDQSSYRYFSEMIQK